MIENVIQADNRQEAVENIYFEKCVQFLDKIGIEVIMRTLPTSTFLPGLSIEEGKIIIDRHQLNYPGDILHEAGHIAVVPSAERSTLNAVSIEQRQNREAEEMMAIAWSYAACIHLEIDSSFVFHDYGYKGGGSNLRENFQEKRYIGLPMLQWIGLTLDEKNASEQHIPPYPFMKKWLRD